MLGPWGLVIGGSTLALLLLFQILTGKRVIKFKGRTHMKVHRWTGYTLGALAVVHAFGGITFAFGL